jgi:hypothetical protein
MQTQLVKNNREFTVFTFIFFQFLIGVVSAMQLNCPRGSCS